LVRFRRRRRIRWRGLCPGGRHGDKAGGKNGESRTEVSMQGF
jgi:hypothetical protein